jgi:hypothetical protein
MSLDDGKMADLLEADTNHQGMKNYDTLLCVYGRLPLLF